MTSERLQLSSQAIMEAEEYIIKRIAKDIFNPNIGETALQSTWLNNPVLQINQVIQRARVLEKRRIR